MGTVLAVVQVVSLVLPLLHQIIVAVEGAFPGAKQGAQKLDAALSVVNAVLPELGAQDAHISAAQPALGRVISGLVTVMNASGALKQAALPLVASAPGDTVASGDASSSNTAAAADGATVRRW